MPPEAFARGDAESARLAFAIVAERLACDARELARALLERAVAKLAATLRELIDDYDLDSRTVELVGGGGGAAALVPFAAEKLRFPFRIARDAEVISPLGVALALVRDVVERTIVDPQPEDVLRVRREAIERVVAAGAAPAFVEASVEIDARRNLVRATASGATAAAGDVHVGASATGRKSAARPRRARCASHPDRSNPLAGGEGFEIYCARGARRRAMRASSTAQPSYVSSRAARRCAQPRQDAPAPRWSGFWTRRPPSATSAARYRRSRSPTARASPISER